MINNSLNINDLRIPPANRLEKLKGFKDPIYSIRINDQWRIIFKVNKQNQKEMNTSFGNYSGDGGRNSRREEYYNFKR